jgi:antitoxin CcdA
MQHTSEHQGPKKAANLSINQALLAEARQLNINLSATLEQALRDRIQFEKRQQWLRDNQQALENCNELAEVNGLFSDSHRVF